MKEGETNETVSTTKRHHVHYHHYNSKLRARIAKREVSHGLQAAFRVAAQCPVDYVPSRTFATPTYATHRCYMTEKDVCFFSPANIDLIFQTHRAAIRQAGGMATAISVGTKFG